MPQANLLKRWMIQFWIFRIYITELESIEAPKRKALQTTKPENPSVNPNQLRKESHEEE